jgi:hypothetical protein
MKRGRKVGDSDWADPPIGAYTKDSPEARKGQRPGVQALLSVLVLKLQMPAAGWAAVWLTVVLSVELQCTVLHAGLTHSRERQPSRRRDEEVCMPDSATLWSPRQRGTRQAGRHDQANRCDCLLQHVYRSM